ncbi:MAG: hypothetical protein FD165_322 [Gammaproteobacteria bacterium]|nr:MAG: hypothetical protein FD165_322 [Gammaproteobacteria bacterium]TND06901.1 MAG: hypothetical protein FD120_633 [Gammaproteobacteria bacterium]
MTFRKVAQSITAMAGVVLASCLFTGVARADADPWILVDTRARTLTVNSADRVVKRFDGVAIGRNGAAETRAEGDGQTPLGTFEIAWVNDRSDFRLFFGLNYPTREHAERAFRAHLIDLSTYLDIQLAIDNHRLPPQNTRLGGYIGIHGLGRADPDIHASTNWTQGCVALTDQQIKQLAAWIKPGTRVVIR